MKLNVLAAVNPAVSTI